MVDESEESVGDLEAKYKAYLKQENALFEANEQERAKKAAMEAEKKKQEEFASAVQAEVEKQLAGINAQPDRQPDENDRTFDEDAKKKKNAEFSIGNVAINTEDFSNKEKKHLKTMLQYREHFYKNYKDKVTGKSIPEDAKPYGFQGFLGDNIQVMGVPLKDEEAFGADVVSSWSPADIWCDLIWQAVKCKPVLAGVITQRACSIEAGDGLAVQIRAINNVMSIGSALGACECSSAVSSVFTTYTITLKRYDIYKRICNLDLWDIGFVLRDAITEAMAQDFALGIDSLVWNQLQVAAPVYVETALASFVCTPHMGIGGNPSYSCCSYSANLYQSILQLRARMKRAGYGQHGFYLILSHRVANYLKWKEGIQVPPWMASVVKMNGSDLVGIGNDIKVIEYCSAQDCTDSYNFKDTYKTAPTMAYLVDPDRAVGEAYGKTPSLRADEDPLECDQWKLIMRSYVGISKLSDGAIGVIRNP